MLKSNIIISGNNLHDSSLYILMPSHSQVVITTPHCDLLLSIGVLLRYGEILTATAHFPKYPVRVILLLLGHLIQKELLIVEQLRWADLCVSKVTQLIRMFYESTFIYFCHNQDTLDISRLKETAQTQ